MRFWLLLLLALQAAAWARTIEDLTPRERASYEAATQHTLANETGKPEDFAKAAAMYREYLDKFSTAEEHYEYQWYLADALFRSGDVEGAAQEYASLLSTATAHPYGKMALYRLALVRRQMVIRAYTSPVERPPDAIVERTVALPSGKERSVYALTSLHRAYIEMNDRLLETDFRKKIDTLRQQAAVEPDTNEKELLLELAEELTRHADALDANKPALAYESAQIYYNFGHLVEARRRFNAIINRWPERDEAAYSASLILDSYAQEEIYGLPPGPRYKPPPPTYDDPEMTSAQGLANEAESAAYRGDRERSEALRLQAAEAFLAFAQAHPDSNYLPDAIYSAATNYNRAGRIDESNPLFIQFVDRWPDDKRAWPYAFMIAYNYASNLDLPEAIRYYDLLYQHTHGKTYGDAPTALFYAAFLRIGTGDYEGAARNFERYAEELPDFPDAEQVMFLAGAQWERHDSQEAIAFYRRYLARYDGASPERSLRAYHQIAALTAASGQDARPEWGALQAAYVRLGSPADPVSRHLAAMAAIHLLEPQIAAFPLPSPPDPTPADVRSLLHSRQAELRTLEDHLLQIAALHGDPEATIAALYLAGTLHLSYAEMLASTPIPAGVDPSLYRAALDREHVAPARETGINRLIAALDASATAGIWVDWSEQAQARLADLDPAKYSPPREEIRARYSPSTPSAGPVPVRQEGSSP